MNDELGMSCKEAVLGYFESLPNYAVKSKNYIVTVKLHSDDK
jgi:hypothetical protein